MNQIKQSLVNNKQGINCISQLIKSAYVSSLMLNNKSTTSQNIIKTHNKYLIQNRQSKSLNFLTKNSNKILLQNEGFDRINQNHVDSKDNQFRTDSDVSITSYGQGNTGSNNIIFLSNHQALIPIGPNIGIWDLQQAQRVGIIQTNKDSIYQMLETSQFVITISLSGSVCILDKVQLTQIYQFQAKGSTLIHSAVNDKYIVIACKSSSNNNYNKIEIYSLQDLLDKNNNGTYQPQILKIEQIIKYIILTQNDCVITISENNSIEGMSFNQNKKLKENLHSFTLHQYNLIGENLINTLHFSLESKIQSFQSNSQFGTLLTLKRHLIIFDLLQFQILFSSLVKGSVDPISNLQFIKNSNLLLSPSDNFLLNINCNTLKEHPLPSVIDGDQQTIDRSFQILKVESKGVSPSRNLIKIIDNFLFSSNEDGFIYQDINNLNFLKQYSGLSISATCISVNLDGSYVAVGDIVGNVLIYSCEQSSNSNDPIYQITLNSGIRSLYWHPSGDSITIGTLDGRILKKNIFNKQQLSYPELILSSEGSITTLKLKKHNEKLLLLATTAKGQLIILQENNINSLWEVQSIIQAHLPSNSSEKFGTLDQFAEIWGSCWSCKGTSTIATSSEDQKIHIFDVSKSLPQLINQLDGHKLAVTAIDWKRMEDSLGDIFISCSDDQTIRVYDPNNNFQLLHIFSTSFVKEWHTLTYLSLEEGGSRVAVGAQNGYLFVIDLYKKKFIFAEKIHMGGIEGVIWRGRRIYTCSNDCTWNIVNI